MLLGAIADDFTGATDLANTLAGEGMRTRLFIGAPSGDAADADAGVVALKTRSIPVGEAIAQSLAALERLRALGCRQFVFKHCSTFDSTPAGNIGPVAAALADALDARGVVVCPAFPAAGRTVYQGHLFVDDTLLSESGMERHPLTPMTDPDIRRWLARQTGERAGHVPHQVVRQGADAIRAALAAQEAALVVVDATIDADLRSIGGASEDARLLTGGSGIALGLPANFRRAGLLAHRATAAMASGGPALVLAGSCSRATREQVRRYAERRPAYMIDVARLFAGEAVEPEIASFLHLHGADAPLIYSTDDPATVAALQARYGTERTAAAVEGLLGTIASRAVAGGVRRLVVAGGETSGAVVTALGLRELEIGAALDPGVPMLRTATAAGTMLLALKSGNFGAADFFERALDRMRG